MATDIGIDLGTNSITIYIKGKGIVLREPTVVSIDTRNGKVIDFGEKAYNILGRTPGHIKVIAPLKDGAISDFSVAEQLIRYYIKKVVGNSFFKPRLSICVPTGITDVEARAVQEAASLSNIRKVSLIEEPLASAIGCNLPISEPYGKMVVCLGGGTSDAAVISMNGIVAKASIKVGGNKLDDALIRFVRNKHNVLLGQRTAEQVKIEIGNVYDSRDDIKYRVKGRNLITGLPQEVEISELETFIAYHECMYDIAKMIQSVIERTLPELVGDISDTGVILTGGTALLRGFPEYLAHYLNVKTIVPEKAMDVVAIGTGESFLYKNTVTDGFL